MKNLIYLLLLLYPMILISQVNINWSKNYGGTGIEVAECISNTSDNGFIVTGSSSSNDIDVDSDSYDNDNYWIIKLDNEGLIEWSKNYGGSENDNATSVQQTYDGGYILTGYSESCDGDVSGNNGVCDGLQNKYDFWVLKLNDLGEITWERNYGGFWDETARSIQPTNDGGFIVLGDSGSKDVDVSNNYNSVDIWVLKLNDLGEVEWEKNLGGTDYDFGTSIQQTNDGGYILSGGILSEDTDVSNNYGGTDYWIVKLNELGEIEWEKSYGGSDFDIPNHIEQTSDNGFIVIGYTSSTDFDVSNSYGNIDIWVLKLDKIGNIEWEKSYGGDGNDWGNSIKQTIDLGYIIASTSGNIGNEPSSTNHGNIDCVVFKINSLGEVEWRKNFGGSKFDIANSITQASNGDFIIAGGSESNDIDLHNNHGLVDFWVLSLSDGSTNTDQLRNNIGFNIYPNPSTGNVYIDLDNVTFPYNLTIYDSLGRVSLSEQNKHGFQMVNNLKRGVYFFSLQSENISVFEKVVIQ